MRFFGMSHLGAIFMAPLKYVCLFAAFTQECIFTTLFSKKLFSLKLAHGNVFLCGRPHLGGLVFLVLLQLWFSTNKLPSRPVVATDLNGDSRRETPFESATLHDRED